MSDAAMTPVKRALLEIRELRARLAAVRGAKPCPVAIVGAAVRMPNGVTTLDGFWDLLNEDRDAIRDTPPERWDAGAIFSTDPDAPGMTFARRGAFVDDVASFDAGFFAISPREAESMDPQHRLLLECTWEALENAAIAPSALADTNAGVVVALGNADYGRMLLAEPRDIDAYSTFGGANALASGRIAYALNLRGPNAVVDTACSGSLAAVHLACNHLALGESDTMIVGAANLMLTPEGTISFTKARMLAPDGRCKTFDASADGYVRGEGCAVVVLKRLRDAIAAGDPILAVVRGSAMNHDGKSAGITAPNRVAQVRVVRAALRDAGIDADAVDVVEAHGTGTPLGDSIELHALAEAYAADARRERPLAVGSVKTTLGHLEAAAGLAGLLKIALALDRERLPAHRNVTTPTPLFPWSEHALEIATRARAWPRGDRPRLAGVSSFGFSGTNVHVVLEEAPRREHAGASIGDGAPRLFCISARSEHALRELARRIAAHAATASVPLDVLCRTAHAGRATFPHRLAVWACDAGELARTLAAWSDGAPVSNALAGIANGAPDAHGHVDGDRHVAVEDAARAYVAGSPIDPARDGAGPRCGTLPTYPFERRPFWRPRAAAGAPWETLVEAAREQSRFVPIGWNVDACDERAHVFEALSAQLVAGALAQLGAFTAAGVRATPDDLIRTNGVAPRHRALLLRMLRLLARASMLREGDGETFVSELPLASGDLAACWGAAERFRDEDPDAFAYLQRSAAKLTDLLTGGASPLEVLFGADASMESTYGRGVTARYVNAIAAAVVRAMLAERPRERMFRAIEAGGGTGGTTAALAPLMPDVAEYWFTDVSPAFVSRARRTFGDRPAMRFTTLDLERPAGADLPAGAFDLAVAANVVHATRDAGAAIATLRRLLRPGGVLLLIETTRYHAALDLTFAFLDGWNAFADAYRREHPLLDADAWAALLREHGFDVAERVPEAAAATDAAGHHVILGRADGAVAAPANAARRSRAGAPAARAAQATSRPALDALPASTRRERVGEAIARCVRAALRLGADEHLGARDRFADLGMDSLMALELQQSIASELGLGDRLAATVAFDTGTIESLTQHVLAIVAPDGSAPHEARVEPPRVSADAIAAYSDEEIEALLRRRLERAVEQTS